MDGDQYQSLTQAELRAFIQRNGWTYAKSMPKTHAMKPPGGRYAVLAYIDPKCEGAQVLREQFKWNVTSIGVG